MPKNSREIECAIAVAFGELRKKRYDEFSKHSQGFLQGIDLILFSAILRFIPNSPEFAPYALLMGRLCRFLLGKRENIFDRFEVPSGWFGFVKDFEQILRVNYMTENTVKNYLPKTFNFLLRFLGTLFQNFNMEEIIRKNGLVKFSLQELKQILSSYSNLSEDTLFFQSKSSIELIRDFMKQYDLIKIINSSKLFGIIEEPNKIISLTSIRDLDLESFLKFIFDQSETYYSSSIKKKTVVDGVRKINNESELAKTIPSNLLYFDDETLFASHILNRSFMTYSHSEEVLDDVTVRINFYLTNYFPSVSKANKHHQNRFFSSTLLKIYLVQIVSLTLKAIAESNILKKNNYVFNLVHGFIPDGVDSYKILKEDFQKNNASAITPLTIYSYWWPRLFINSWLSDNNLTLGFLHAENDFAKRNTKIRSINVFFENDPILTNIRFFKESTPLKFVPIKTALDQGNEKRYLKENMHAIINAIY